MNGEKRNLDYKNVISCIKGHKRLFVVTLSITFAVSLIITIFMPRKYTCTVKMTIEKVDALKNSMFNKLFYSYGYRFETHKSEDAMGMWLYEDMFKTNWFVADLLNMQIRNSLGELESYYTHLGGAAEDKNDSIDSYNLNEKQLEIFEKAKKNISCYADLKSQVIRVTATDIDPYVCMILADSASNKLCKYIVDQRIQKAMSNFRYYRASADSAKVKYRLSMRNFNDYSESHMNSNNQVVISCKEMLEDQMLSDYNTYNAFDARAVLAQAIAQERTPAFSILQKPKVPTQPSSPRSFLIILGSLSMVFSCLLFYVIKDDVVYQLFR